MGLIITIIKLISFLLFFIFLVLGLYETIKVYMYFNKEMKKRKVLKEEYNQKAKKLSLYYLVFVIITIICSILKSL
ncbi:formate hydrogenlyase subunit 3/multisubunit Na+/H+ antiporter MnhD subunit [Fictibacillus barbaricus]|uniref:Formate hydrogenlyase subunit 3/multisubunit Na+/H+ antiporter MnhD subunit n=1 Tax=Fictibacillus barbaricus TaxID=182136 RepID=A0ABU1U293_9BACL|nr:formate hydrogenlyase subunit 3/multisubunit Na+/H+ antiporter MnhD subunit [Fictibacillus barbaricus]